MADSKQTDSAAIQAAYDALPYTGNPIEAASVFHLASAAALGGLSPAKPGSARVLEVGAGTGGNLLPMAATLPEAQFLGIDLSPKQVEMANATARKAGLSNIRFEAMDLSEFRGSERGYDYIICHGIYSWMPPDKAEALLALLARHLAPSGVGYVSYNTYPGWRLRGMTRDIMRFHTRDVPDDPESQAARVSQGKQIVAFLEKQTDSLTTNPNQAYALNLAAEAKSIARRRTDYVAHEYLAGYNEPLYFWQFAERIGRHRLKYLCESLPPLWHATGLDTVGQQMPEVANDRVALEQYVDFLMCTFHRQSLVTHASAKLNPANALQLDGFFVRAARHDTVPLGINLTAGVPVPCQTRSDVPISVKDPFFKAMLKVLGEQYPDAAPVGALLDQAARQIGRPSAAAVGERLAQHKVLLHGHRMGLLVLLSDRPRVVSRAGARPLATPLARLQAAEGKGVATLLHQWYEGVDHAERRALRECDGTRRAEQFDRETLKTLARAGLLMG